MSDNKLVKKVDVLQLFISTAAIAGIFFEGSHSANLLRSFAKKAWQTMSELADAPFIDNITEDDADSDEEESD